MPHQLKLLGTFVIEPHDAANSSSKLNRKTRAILAYVAAAGRPQPRRTLYQWFCQDAKDPAGTLRWHLSQIRRKLSPELLLVTRQDVALNQEKVQCDHTQFQATLNNLASCSLTGLTEAINLYRGPFLADLSLKNAPEFELWLLGETGRYQTLYEKGATALVLRHIQAQEWSNAISAAQKLLQTNPLLEGIHRSLIWLYAQTDQREMALQQFEQCRDLLWQELAVAPAEDLLRLHQAIQQNQPLPNILAGDSSPEGLADETEPRQPEQASFIGRALELAQLQRLWQNGRTVALIDSPAGGGKTQLVQQFVHPIQVHHLSSSCYESTRNLPYHPWLAILEQQLMFLDDTVLEQLASHWRQQLGLLLPQLGETAVSPNQQQLFRTVTHLLTELDDQPLMIVIDDLHWADEASLQLLQFVAQYLPHTRSPVMLVATFRSEEADDNPALLTLLSDLGRLNHFSHVTLAPFTPAETEELIATIWRDLPEGFRSPHMRNTLLQATGGNPLFMTEILQEMALVKTLSNDLPIPPGLAELIARRLGQLPSNGRQVIEALAILDQPAHFELAQQISGRNEEDTITAVEAGLRWRLLQVHEQYQIDFSHDLTRTAVLQQISPVRQQRLHYRAATALQQRQAEAATLAYHWRMAGDAQQEAHFAAQAGKEAARVYAHDEAISHYRRALTLPLEPVHQLPLMRDLAEVLILIGERGEAETLYGEGLALAQQQGLETETAYYKTYMGRLLIRQGNYQEALTWLSDAIPIFEKLGDKEGLSSAEGDRGLAYWYLGDYEKALHHLQLRQQLAEEVGAQQSASIAIANMGIVYWSMGQLDEALACFRQKLAIDETLEDRLSISKVYGNMGLVYASKGDFVEALACYEQKLFTDAELGDQEGVSKVLASMGMLYGRQGDTQAITCLQKGLQITLAIGDLQGSSTILGNLLSVYIRQDDVAAASQIADKAIALGRQVNSPLFLCSQLYDKAMVCFKEGDLIAAQKFNDEAVLLAAKANHQETFYKAQILAVALHLALAEWEKGEAVRALRLMLKEHTKPAEQADLFYALWHITSEDETVRQTAVSLYKQLYEQTPDVLYNNRYIELAGQALPPAPALPDLPPFITEELRPLPQLLARVDEIIAQ